MRPTIDPRLLQRRLTSAFLAIPRHLPCRPEPRHVFDNVARASNPLPPRGADLLALYQGVMAAAIATRDLGVIEQTQGEIIAYHEELLAQALADSPLLASVCFRDTARQAVEETAEALSAIGVAGITAAPGDSEKAVREAGEAIASLELFRETAGRIPRRRLSLARS